MNSFENLFELQGKEKEMTFNLNRVDFGARVYNPTIGRWDRNDPAGELYYGYSGYNYVLNNPLSLTDPNGMWVNEGNRVTTDIPEEIAAFMDGVRGQKGGDDDDKKKNNLNKMQSLPIGDIGTGLGFAGEVFWALGENKSADLYKEGFRRGIEGNYKLTGRNFSLFGNQPMTEASKPLTNLTKIGKLGKNASNVGTMLSVGSLLAFDIPSYNEGSISASRLGYRVLSTGSSWLVASYVSGPYGALLGAGLTGLEKVYDGTKPTRKEIRNSYDQFKRTLTSSWLNFK
ncbi:RHS repeat-associated core domain-containing protein [Leadbetterella sp. DM7]|uniref:RHS repeat-associated core domain-containing protein n=1 Tax=Leadbetterella sp. DM7 TaxID=3235085 RepID=UPI00349E5A6E